MYIYTVNQYEHTGHMISVIFKINFVCGHVHDSCTYQGVELCSMYKCNIQVHSGFTISRYTSHSVCTFLCAWS